MLSPIAVAFLLAKLVVMTLAAQTVKLVKVQLAVALTKHITVVDGTLGVVHGDTRYTVRHGMLEVLVIIDFRYF